MFYVYVLQSANGKSLYYGFSSNLKQRFKTHQEMPKHAGWKLIYYEAYLNEQNARDRERMLKEIRSCEGTSQAAYETQPFYRFRKCWVTACLLLNESASYYQWRA